MIVEELIKDQEEKVRESLLSWGFSSEWTDRSFRQMRKNRNGGSVDFESLKDEIKESEGCRHKAYQLKFNGYQEPFYTIGFGHKVQPNDKIDINKIYSHKEIEKWFELDFSVARRSADDLLGDCHPAAKEVGIECCFVLGRTGFSKFKKTIKFIKDGSHKEASKEIKDSKWYQQVRHRVEALSKKLKEI